MSEYDSFLMRTSLLEKESCFVMLVDILSTKKSVLKIHVSSEKHQDGKQKLKRSKLRKQTIPEVFKREVLSQKIALCLWKNVLIDSKLSPSF